MKASPRAAHRKTGQTKAGESKGETAPPSLAEHDRPMDVARAMMIEEHAEGLHTKRDAA